VTALILASGSPRRRELLGRAGVELEVRPADIDETPLADEAPAAYVARIAAAKADTTPRPSGRWVLAADTTVTIDGAILAKAETAAEAAAMIRRLAGRTHRVITAFCVIGDHARRLETVVTEVDVVAMSAADVTDYVATGEWRGKAGGYAIQGVASALTAAVRGSVTNVIGLPLVEVLAVLRELGAPGARLAAGNAV
jgi:septum formation protein